MNKSKLQNLEDSLRAFKGEQNDKVELGLKVIEVDTVSVPLKVKTKADLSPETVAGVFQVLVDIGAIRRISGSSLEVNNGQEQIEEV